MSEKGTTGHEIDRRGVNHPRHYNSHPAGIECIDVIEHMTANIAFVIKHLWRAGLKEGEATLKDIDKALWYLNRERQRIEKMQAEAAVEPRSQVLCANASHGPHCCQPNGYGS